MPQDHSETDLDLGRAKARLRAVSDEAFDEPDPLDLAVAAVGAFTLGAVVGWSKEAPIRALAVSLMRGAAPPLLAAAIRAYESSSRTGDS